MEVDGWGSRSGKVGRGGRDRRERFCRRGRSGGVCVRPLRQAVTEYLAGAELASRVGVDGLFHAEGQPVGILAVC